MSERDNSIEDIHAEIVSLQMSTHIEGRCDGDERLEYIAEQLGTQAERLHVLQDELEQTIEEWRDKGDTLIHEGDNEYVEGRGGQLAKCSNDLEGLVWNE